MYHDAFEGKGVQRACIRLERHHHVATAKEGNGRKTHGVKHVMLRCVRWHIYFSVFAEQGVRAFVGMGLDIARATARSSYTSGCVSFSSAPVLLGLDCAKCAVGDFFVGFALRSPFMQRTRPLLWEILDLIPRVLLASRIHFSYTGRLSIRGDAIWILLNAQPLPLKTASRLGLVAMCGRRCVYTLACVSSIAHAQTTLPSIAVLWWVR
jgi:hypothetical protein